MYKSEISIAVTVVLYENEYADVCRMLKSLDASIENTKMFQKVLVRIGDCSKSQMFSLSDIEGLGGQTKHLIIDYVFFAKNLHHSLGINRLCDSINEEAILILNPDSMLSSNTIEEMIKRYDGKNLIEARQFPIEHTKPFDHLTGKTSWSSGCCLLVPSNVFRSLQGFDHQVFPNYANDVDFSWRAKLLGSDSIVATNAFVYHDKKFDTETKSVVVSELEKSEGMLAYLLMSRKYRRDEEYSKTLQWLSSNYDGFSSIKKSLITRIPLINQFDTELIESKFFSISGGIYGAADIYDLKMSERDLKFRESRSNNEDRSMT